MIDFIKGKITEIGSDYAVIDVGNVGFYINTSSTSSSKLNLFEETTLFTKLIVKEDNIQLAGFLSNKERQMYNLLTSVSKIGMKLALTMLSVYTPEDLAYLISIEDENSISKVPGFGKKTAQRLILELKDKLKNSGINISNSSDNIAAEADRKIKPETPSIKTDAIAALAGLGFTENESENAVKEALCDIGDTSDVGTVIKTALAHINKRI